MKSPILRSWLSVALLHLDSQSSLSSMKTTRALVAILAIILGLAVQVQAQSFLTNGLVLYYPFDGNANDASGNGNNGTVEGATLTTDRFGNPNSAYYFNGVNNDILVPECVFGKWQKSTLTLLYKGFHSYRWEGCKRIQLIIQLT